MRKNGLYQTLLRALYAVEDAENVAFLCALAEELPFKPKGEDRILAVFPNT